ncbi:MAG TPA: hypothetical protein VG944_18210 [Fimbriimonas sp.]|nr:hypothetical protein [Fimbriimonas sp.]
MRTLAILATGAVLVTAFGRTAFQSNLPEPLASDFSKLSSAKSLKLDYTNRVVGEAPVHYTLDMTKDKEFKLTWDGGFVQSDGTNLYTYNKAKNTYTKEAITDDVLAKFEKRPEVVGWAAFLQKDPSKDIEGASQADSKSMKGNPVQGVNVSWKGGKTSAVIYVDTANGVTRGYTFKTGGKEYLAIADKVDLSSDPIPDSEFAFTAPDGATLVEVQSDGATFADVQSILNDNCMPCHNSTNKRASIDLSNYSGVSAVVTANNPSDSLLIKSVKGDGVDKMPKGRPALSSDQIKKMSDWISAGAKNE